MPLFGTNIKFKDQPINRYSNQPGIYNGYIDLVEVSAF